MEPTFVLILLVIVMLIGSYLAGSIPLVVSMSEEKLRIITIFGAGLLVGTALTVIIPEGIRALYSDILTIPQQQYYHQQQQLQQQQQRLQNNAGGIGVAGGGSDSLIIENTLNPTNTNYNNLNNFDDNYKENQHKLESQASEYTSTIGISLVLGFVFMMLVDQISSRRKQSGATISGTSVAGTSSSPSGHILQSSQTSDKNSTATIGLVVHAAADGIALGAAATTSHPDVEMIVFLAIMLHKAPAAFGLVSFLLHEGIDRQRIRKHLAIFSLSAPLLTLFTYFGIGQEQKETLNSLNATGIAMLFSAGTFLYVATVHVLPELTSNQQIAHHHHHNHHPHTRQHHHKSTKYNQYIDEQQEQLLLSDSTSTATDQLLHQSQQQQQFESPASPSTQILMQQSSPIINKGYTGLKNFELAILITGALLPLLLTMGHHH